MFFIQTDLTLCRYASGKIKFDNILADSDGSWDFRRSEFRCTDPGYYYISFHGLCRTNSGLTCVSITVARV